MQDPTMQQIQVKSSDGGPVGSRENTVPFLETIVNAAEVDPSGQLLFTSFGGDVRIWNLEKWASFGRLVGAVNSPRSEVSCLAVAEGSEGMVKVFTGSRDHYVKMFYTPAGGAVCVILILSPPNSQSEGVYESSVNFSPPHYDNVTCIVPFGGSVLTASKDKNIMKFSLIDQKRDHLELNAHNNFIQGMCLVGIVTRIVDKLKKPMNEITEDLVSMVRRFYLASVNGNASRMRITRYFFLMAHTERPLLCSVCKEGTMKFWDITTSRRFKLVEEIAKAHNEPIYSVCSNKSIVFTASSIRVSKADNTATKSGPELV
ncbi:WD domain, G-beta repeat protein [Dictyocaulus viviparus]|uniref:WD domain, G-beta repeat protein n=1 Tax=Dictyocaulus viviparus TaxID=29172 RepID=A0A0D8XMH4_DICVI|nr:WD domain, G-beta repeat protein [Dictyocaulus viviparus]